MSEHTWASSHVVLTHCPHGLDLRIYPVCYLCNPRQEREVPEAVDAERARIRAAVEGLRYGRKPTGTTWRWQDGWDAACAAVLAAIDGGGK